MFNFLLKRKIKNIIKNSTRKKAYKNLKEINTVLVLFDTENYTDADRFIKKLKQMGKKVDTYAYKSKTDPNDYSKTFYTIVQDKDRKDLKATVLNQIRDTLKETTYDLVIDLSLAENLLLQYILVSADSSFKVGLYKSRPPVHDMTILPAPDIDLNRYTLVKELSEQLIYYLTTISSETAKA